VAAANTVLSRPVVLAQSDVTFGSYDFTTKTYVAGGSPANAVQVVGQNLSGGDGKVQMTFGRVLGQNEANVTQTATAAYLNRYFQLQLQISDDWLCDIDNAADAAVSLLDYLHSTANNSQGDQIGLDEFTGRTQMLSALAAVKPNASYNAIKALWARDATVLGYPSSTWVPQPVTKTQVPPPPPQTRGITVCSKANDPNPTGFDTPNVLYKTPGAYRQCPSTSSGAPLAPASQQFAFPNHGYMPLRCSDGGPVGLYAGTNLAGAINDGVAKLTARAQTFEPKSLILLSSGTPMACTGIGGGGLCGGNHTYDSDHATPPAGKTGSDHWDPCCANGLTCGANQTYSGSNPKFAGFSFGGGDYDDASPGSSPGGSTACDAAHQLVVDTINAAEAARAAGVSIYTIGFYKSPSLEATFVNNLTELNGVAATTKDSTQLAAMLQAIPKFEPVVLVR
jgi:Putative Tad-like Flp pilus-assembly